MTMYLTGVDVISHPCENIKTKFAFDIYTEIREKATGKTFILSQTLFVAKLVVQFFVGTASFLVFTRCLDSGERRQE